MKQVSRILGKGALRSAFFIGGTVRQFRSSPATATMIDSGHNRTFAAMTDSRTELEAAEGKLITAIQKERHWPLTAIDQRQSVDIVSLQSLEFYPFGSSNRMPSTSQHSSSIR